MCGDLQKPVATSSSCAVAASKQTVLAAKLQRNQDQGLPLQISQHYPSVRVHVLQSLSPRLAPFVSAQHSASNFEIRIRGQISK
jgi:hypothetical protein